MQCRLPPPTSPVLPAHLLFVSANPPPPRPQDDVLNSTHLAYMPALNSLLGSRGTRFANTISSTSVCCPARVSLLTGRLAHCSNVTSNWAPTGERGSGGREGCWRGWRR